jgi:hypothetical protein
MIYESDQLHHHGVKGMKWGVRNKQELRLARRYAKVGRTKGRIDYMKTKAKEASAGYDRDAKVLDKQAKAWDKKGHVIAAEVARRRSETLKARSAEARSEYEAEAKRLTSLAERQQQKASKYATKKRVSLGKSTVDKIIGDTRKQSYEREKRWEEHDKDFEEFLKENNQRTSTSW